LEKIENEEKNKEKKNAAFIKTQNILTELMSTLNFDQGGDIAKNLMALYQYMYQRTVSANIEKNQDAADEVIGYLEELRDAWSQI